MNVKNNRRFHDTEISMEAAMLDLMKEMEFEKITVKKICERAQVNRSTFYAHFIDIFDMMDKMEQELRKELLNSYLEHNLPEERTMFSMQSFHLFLQHIKKHHYFYKINLKTRKEFPLKQGYERMWNDIIKLRCKQAGISSEEDMMCYFIYFQAGFTMLLKHWVDTDCKEAEEKLAEIIENCIPSVLK